MLHFADMVRHDNDNDTWTLLSVAAERVLTKVNEIEDEMTREDQETNRENVEADHETEHATRDAVLIEDKKWSSR